MFAMKVSQVAVTTTHAKDQQRSFVPRETICMLFHTLMDTADLHLQFRIRTPSAWLKTSCDVFSCLADVQKEHLPPRITVTTLQPYRSWKIDVSKSCPETCSCFSGRCLISGPGQNGLRVDNEFFFVPIWGSAFLSGRPVDELGVSLISRRDGTSVFSFPFRQCPS